MRILIPTVVAMTFTLFDAFSLHLDKVVGNKLMIQADDDMFFSIDVTTDMHLGDTIQVVTGYQAPTACTNIHFLGEIVNPLIKWVFGQKILAKAEEGAEEGVLAVAGKFVSTKTIKVGTVKFIKESETLVFSGVAEIIETGV